MGLVAFILVLGLVGGTVAAGPRDRDRQDGGGAEPAPESDGAAFDSDGDLFPDSIDNCASVPNADQGDADGDGFGDACQPRAVEESSDIDGDGVDDKRDNCPEVANGGQGDADGDGLGNQCDGSPNGEAPPPVEPPPVDATRVDDSQVDGPPVDPSAVDAPPVDGAPPAGESESGGNGGGGDRSAVPRGDATSEQEVNNGGDRGNPTADAPRQRDGDVPVFQEAPRAPEGPPPALKPFVVREVSYQPIIRIDAGSVSPEQIRADSSARPAASRKNHDAKPVANNDREVAEAVAPPASGERSGDRFLDEEEAMLGGGAAPEADASAAVDPLDGSTPGSETAAETERRGWLGADQTEPEGGLPTGDDPELVSAEREKRADVIDENDSTQAPRPAPADQRGTPSQDGSWEADDLFTGGSARTRAEVKHILGTERDEVYLTQRSGRGDAGDPADEFSYDIPVPNDGTYLVRLHFAEIYWGATGAPDDGAGQRLFSVDAEGRPELVEYDIFADVGPMTAVVKEFEVEITDGRLGLDFYASRDQPVVSAIEVLAQPDGERWVDVDKSAETVRLMVGESVVARYQASLSASTEDDFHDTMPGSYQIQSKIAELTWTPYAQNYFMYWAGFDPGRENGFHSWVMDYKGRVVPNGDGPTWGCVATAPEDAAEIYSFVEIGTPVEVHW